MLWSGRRLFTDGNGAATTLNLVRSTATTTGIIIATYARS
jgi:hypothetical protein